MTYRPLAHRTLAGRRTVAGCARGVVALVVLGLLGACGGEPGAFSPRGPEAREVGALFWVMVGLGGAVFVAVMALLVLAGRGRRPGDPDPARRSARLVLGGGIVLPIVVLVPLSVAMVTVGARNSHRSGPADVHIEVIGHQYWWEIRYPDHDVVTANELHIPVGRPVRLALSTADVIHSVWVPQLAGKIDMIPGQDTSLRLEADEAGEYLGQCAEFCGLQHARMRFLVIAQPEEEFARWLEAQAEPARAPTSAAAERGAEVFAAAGCGSCHRVAGTGAEGGGDALVAGPDLTHLASRRTLGAATLPNGRGQLAGWVADPQGVKPGSLMPPSPVDGRELLDLVAYLEELG